MLSGHVLEATVALALEGLGAGLHKKAVVSGLEQAGLDRNRSLAVDVGGIVVHVVADGRRVGLLVDLGPHLGDGLLGELLADLVPVLEALDGVADRLDGGVDGLGGEGRASGHHDRGGDGVEALLELGGGKVLAAAENGAGLDGGVDSSLEDGLGSCDGGGLDGTEDGKNGDGRETHLERFFVEKDEKCEKIRKFQKRSLEILQKKKKNDAKRKLDLQR